jgi:hypothetical protein
MAEENPIWRAPRTPASWAGVPLEDRSWGEIPGLPPLVRADGTGAAEQPTLVRVCWDEAALYVRFECVDRDAWGTYGWRDDPIWKEEAAEVFLAPGLADPVNYFEFEVSPVGVLFDARIFNPTSMRADMKTEVAWDCAGLQAAVGRTGEREDWWAALEIPWSGLGQEGGRQRLWRANFYRIEQPRDSAPELTAWSPTFAQPADFHKPARFGRLELVG